MQNRYFSFLVFTSCLLFMFGNASAGLEQAEVYFLKGEYDIAMSNCDGIINSSAVKDIPQAYYLKGQILLKQGKIEEAQNIFEKVLADFPDSKFCDAAQLGLADTYFSQKDYQRAIGEYRKIQEKYNQSQYKAIALYKLGKSCLAGGDMQQARFYFQKLQEDYPLSFESKLVDELDDKQFSYSVQVGCFSKYENAEGLVAKLKKQGFDAYVNEKEGFPVFYRVRVGNFKTDYEAKISAVSLQKKGYKTKLCP